MSSDDNEQYNRRSCLCIYGIPLDDANKNENIHVIIEQCYKEENLDLKCDEIDQAHRIGKCYVEKTSGKKVKSFIIKYKSWDVQSRFYKARPEGNSEGKKIPGSRVFTVSVDLTKRRYNWLTRFKKLIKDKASVHYVFANVNCSLVMQMHDHFSRYFYTDSQLETLCNA